MTWDIQLVAKMVRNDVKIANRWRIDEKGVEIPKLGFLLDAMPAQEWGCVCRIPHACVGWNLRAYELKNRHTRVRTSLCMHECICMNPGYARKNTPMHVGLNLRTQEQTQKVVLRHFQFFSTKTHPKHVPTPSKVSDFHLNPFHNKIQEFTSLKIDQNGRSKEKTRKWKKKKKEKKTHWSSPCT